MYNVYKYKYTVSTVQCTMYTSTSTLFLQEKREDEPKSNEKSVKNQCRVSFNLKIRAAAKTVADKEIEAET